MVSRIALAIEIWDGSPGPGTRAALLLHRLKATICILMGWRHPPHRAVNYTHVPVWANVYSWSLVSPGPITSWTELWVGEGFRNWTYFFIRRED